MKDTEAIQSLFDDKYEAMLNMSYEEWLEKGPQTEEEAYARCNVIDRELEATYEEWFEGTGDAKEQLGEYRGRLKAEYDLLEDVFGLEAVDKNY